MTDTNQTASEGIVITSQPLPVPLINSEQRAKEFRDQLAALNKPAVEEEAKSNNEEHNDADDRTDNHITGSNDIRGNNVDNADNDDTSDNDYNDANNDSDDLQISNIIPKKRFNKELQKRKEIEQALQQEREARIRIETQLNMFNEAAKKFQETKQQDEIPDITPLDDEAHAYYINQINSLKKDFETKLQEITTVQTQSKFETTVTTQAEAFKKKHADFDDAYKFIINKESKNAKLMGLNDDEAFQFALQKLQPMAWNVYSKGGNVAETIYNMAENYGYSAKGNKKSNGINLHNVSKNSKLSSSIIDDVPAVASGMVENAHNYLHLDGFKSLDRKDGKGVDPDKFRKALQNLQNNR